MQPAHVSLWLAAGARRVSARPETRYARSGDVTIAYQVVGDGPVDLVYVPGFLSHVEWSWEHPPFARFLQRLASFSRLILFDKRGTGLSDPVAGVPAPEERMDDIRAVMDAAGSERAALFGVFEGGPLSRPASPRRYPDRVVGARPLRGAREVHAGRRATPGAGARPRSSSTSSASEDGWGSGDGAELLRQGWPSTTTTGAGSRDSSGCRPAPGRRRRSCG